MWICLTNGFISVVQKPGDTNTLTVRARAQGHIENVFPGAKVVTGQGTDYLYRARVSRAEVAKVIHDQIMGIGYANFKNAVKDDPLHDAYAGCWGVMNRYQIQRAHAPRKGRQAKLNLAGAH